jgi:hypothetical protein
MNRAQLFYDLSKLLEKYVGQSSGIEDDIGIDEHEVDAKKFVGFFRAFWEYGWLADSDTSFVYSWAPWAAGIVENITLDAMSWVDRYGNTLQVRRFVLDDEELENELRRKKESGELAVKRSEINNTDITI